MSDRVGLLSDLGEQACTHLPGGSVEVLRDSKRHYDIVLFYKESAANAVVVDWHAPMNQGRVSTELNRAAFDLEAYCQDARNNVG